MHDTTKEGMRAIAKARIEAAAKPRKGGVGSVFARASAKAGIDRKDGALSIAIAAPGDNVIEFDPDTLQRSPTNREWFDEVKAAELAESVKIHGVLQPGIVRPLKQPIGKITHEIVMGERRWRAAKKAKRKFPAKIRELTDLEALELQAVENFQREDLNPIDEAAKFQQLRDAYEGAGATKTAALDMICERTGKASSTIAQRLALLKLPSEIVTLTQRGALPPSHATALGKVKDPATVASLAAQIMHPKDGKDEEGVMPIRQAEQLVKAAVQRENNLTAWQKEETEFKAKGFGVLTREECKKYLFCRDDSHHWWVLHDGPYVKGDDWCSLNGSGSRKFNALWKKAPLPILGRLPDGRPVHVYDVKLANAMVVAGGRLYKSGSSGGSSGTSETEREKTRAHNARKVQFKSAIATIVTEIECVAESSVFWKFFANCLVRQWRSEPITRTLKRRGLESRKALAVEMGKMGAGELRALCAEILLYAHAPSMWSEGWSGGFLESCALFKAQLQAWNGKGFVDFHAPGSGDDDEP